MVTSRKILDLDQLQGGYKIQNLVTLQNRIVRCDCNAADSPISLKQNQPIADNPERITTMISEFIPEAAQLTKLGFHRKSRPTLASIFNVQKPTAMKRELPIKPDVDYHPEAEREPQAPNYTAMWLDHFTNVYGNIRNPIGEPMKSGA